LRWDPSGTAFFVEYQHAPETGYYTDYIFRVRSDFAGGWLAPEPIMTNVGTDPFQRQLGINGVSLDGLVGYSFLNPDYSGNASPFLRGILDPDSCTPDPCDGNDGLVLMEGRAGPWTAEGTILYWEDGDLYEYVDPFGSPESRIIIIGADESDPDL
jgi:hypothetical protein